MTEIETWKKVLTVVGTITQTIGYFTNSNTLIITG